MKKILLYSVFLILLMGFVSALDNSSTTGVCKLYNARTRLYTAVDYCDGNFCGLFNASKPSQKIDHCGYGCENGACLDQAYLAPLDSDGGRIYDVKGKAICIDGGVSDYCSYELGVSNDLNQLVEYWCNQWGNNLNNEIYTCPNGCYDGACLPENTDEDNDGVNDEDDLCPETPEGETVNVDGCSCSQIDIPFKDCSEDMCIEENWMDYPEDGYDTCEAGVITEEYLCEAISSTYDPECDVDDDDDGVLDEDDKCSNTVLPESIHNLKSEHYADVDGDMIFETKKKSIIDSKYRLEDTYGCSCEQILDIKPGKNLGEKKYGCTIGTITKFILQKKWTIDLFN